MNHPLASPVEPPVLAAWSVFCDWFLWIHSLGGTVQSLDQWSCFPPASDRHQWNVWATLQDRDIRGKLKDVSSKVIGKLAWECPLVASLTTLATRLNELALGWHQASMTGMANVHVPWLRCSSIELEMCITLNRAGSQISINDWLVWGAL